MVFQAGPGWESCWPAFGASLCSRTWPVASAAALADEVPDFLFFESLASAGVIANTTMVTALTRLGRINCLAFCIMNLLAIVSVNFNPEHLSKAYAATWCGIDQESSVG